MLFYLYKQTQNTRICQQTEENKNIQLGNIQKYTMPKKDYIVVVCRVNLCGER